MKHRWILVLGLGLAVAGLVTPAEADDPETWLYMERQEPMGRGAIKYALVVSTNAVTFDFPYGGPQVARLQLRTHPTYGKDVILMLERAQFLCRTSDDSCRVTMRFDGGKPQSFSAVGPDDDSTATLFIRGYDRIVPQLRKAKTLQIEANFYRDGRRVFEFDVAELTWETPAKPTVKPKAKAKWEVQEAQPDAAENSAPPPELKASNRAIAEALGVNQSTVRRDLADAEASSDPQSDLAEPDEWPTEREASASPDAEASPGEAEEAEGDDKDAEHPAAAS